MALAPLREKSGVLQHELVQDRGSVQILGEEGLAGVGIGALGPDLAVVPQHQLGGEALSQHVVVIVHIIKRDDEGLFSPRGSMRVFRSMRVTPSSPVTSLHTSPMLTRM